MELNNMKVKTQTGFPKVKINDDKKDDTNDKSVMGAPANTNGIIDKHEEKTLIRMRAKTAKMFESDIFEENTNKSIVGFNAKTSGIINKKEEKSLIKRPAKTAKFVKKE